jgi:hypothetical protein
MDLHSKCRALASCGTAPSSGIGNEKIFGLKFELSQKLRQFFFDVFFFSLRAFLGDLGSRKLVSIG